MQALEALGVLAFIGATDLESTEAIMAYLWSVINHRHSPEDQVRHILDGINAKCFSISIFIQLDFDFALTFLS